MAMKDPQARTKQIIKDDIETIRAYADASGVEMPDLDERTARSSVCPRRTPARSPGSVRQRLPHRIGHRKAVETGMPFA